VEFHRQLIVVMSTLDNVAVFTSAALHVIAHASGWPTLVAFA